MALPKVKKILPPKKKTAKKDKRNLAHSIGQYFSEVRSEFKKVIWPSRKETISASLVVFAAILFFVAYIGILDIVFAAMVKNTLPIIGG